MTKYPRPTVQTMTNFQAARNMRGHALSSQPALAPVRWSLVIGFLVLGHCSTHAFEKKEARERLARFVQTFDMERFTGQGEVELLGWLYAAGEKGWDFLKDTYNDAKEPKTKQTALYLFCRGWPDRASDRLLDARTHKDEGLRRYATRLKIRLDDERRALYAQIIDDARLVRECAVLEGRAFKHFLRRCATLDEGWLEERKDDALTVEQLKQEPARHRGAVLSRHGVVIESELAELTPEYGLPGYSVIRALFVTKLRELFELRILCAPGRGAPLLKKLQEGHDAGKNPVARLSGFFFKCHAKTSSKPEDGAWREPLLIVPEPSFPKMGWEANAREELEDTGYAKQLPSVTIDAPKAEERLVVELLAGAQMRLRIEGEEGPLDAADLLKRAVEKLKARLPQDQRAQASAVLVFSQETAKPAVAQVLEMFKALGLARVFYCYLPDEAGSKRENGKHE